MNASEVMKLLEEQLHPLSPVILAQAFELDEMTPDGIIIDRKRSPRHLQAARALVKIGALKVIGAGEMKAITPANLVELRLGMVVDFFKAPGFVLTDKPREAIMEWINSLPH